ncbi:hypothetical protein OSB04_013817 [Centaurea solstitialis]|uniref:Dirigent protein n=1 Tax=Centaurea solstitialis TaxID=347529 RepID=A0AA38TLI4_9ASTR|nr:hypothetical protein OSB04_013817 [Centaurea solstitialis]
MNFTIYLNHLFQEREAKPPPLLHPRHRWRITPPPFVWRCPHDHTPVGFGAIVMIDDLDGGPERTSKIVGRPGDIRHFDILGRIRDVTVREMPIVAEGLFRFARGYALAKTVFFNISNGDAVLSITFVYHECYLDAEITRIESSSGTR